MRRKERSFGRVPSLVTYTSLLSFPSGRFEFCFNTWLAQQHQDLEELNHGAASYAGEPVKLLALVEKNVRHFEDYRENRSLLARQNSPAFLCPAWCSSLENSLLWIGGCRASLGIRLVYSLCGSELDARLEQYLLGEKKGTLGEISATQMNQIGSLHMRTVREEERLSSIMASLQEDIADEPLTTMAVESKYAGEPSERVTRALDNHASKLGRMLSEADRLRMSTLRELVTILTPLQAAHLMIATKQLHLSVHEWGKRRDSGNG